MRLDRAKYEAFSAFRAEIEARTKRLCVSLDREARAAAQAAGLSLSYPYLHAHNALVGDGWPSMQRDPVAKAQARRVLYLERKQWEIRALGDRITDKAWRKVFVPE